MSLTRTPSFVYYPLLCLIILFSFYNFAEIFTPLLNPDMAVTVLMAQGVEIPANLYFWGQDHGGALVPLLANLLCEAYKFPPIMAVSVIHFLILITGFFALASLFRSRQIRLLLALVWFFPSWHFVDQVLLLYGVQMSLIAIVLYLIRKMQHEPNLYIQLGWLCLAGLTMIAAVWVSDLALVSILILAGIAVWKYEPLMRRKRIRFFLGDRNTRYQVLVLAVFFILGAAFVLYARHKAVRIESYRTHVFSHPGEILASLRILFSAFYKVLIFASENIVESIYAWSALLGIPLIFHLSNTRNRLVRFCAHNRWMVFFALNGLLTLFLLLISRWVYLNGTSRSYFTVVVLSLWIAFLFYTDATGSRNRRLRMALMSTIVLLGAVSSFSSLYFPRVLPSRASELSFYSKLGDAGLIADYKYAYPIASVDPKHVKATPYDTERVRDFSMAEEVFRMPKLFLAADCTRDTFPDTTMQHGHLLLKKGNAFHCNGLTLCRYERIYYSRTFTCDEMQHQGTVTTDPSSGSGKSVRIGNSFDRTKHFVYGPFISLKKGTILVQFSLRSDPDFDTRTLAVLEVATGYGKEIIARKPIRSCDFQRRDSFQLFDIKTALEKDYDGVEFRILYQGGSDLFFDKVDLTGM